MRFFRQDVTGDRGASMVEYGLIVAVIALMALSAVTLLGERTEETFTTVAAELEGTDSDEGANSDSGQESDDSDDQSGNSGDQTGNTGGQNQDDQNQDDQNQDDQDDQDDQDQDDQDQDDQNQDDDSDDDSHDQQGDDNADDSGNNGDDSGNNGDDSGNNGDASGNDSGSDDNEDEDAGADPVVSSTESDFYWWNDTKHGGNGAWTASVSYSNDTNRHQYLDLRITRVDEKGNESVSTSNNFYVPAGGSTTYTHWNNELRDHKGRLTGTVAVKVEVTKVLTSDQNWQTVSYDVDGEPATVEAPSTR